MTTWYMFNPCQTPRTISARQSIPEIKVIIVIVVIIIIIIIVPAPFTAYFFYFLSEAFIYVFFFFSFNLLGWHSLKIKQYPCTISKTSSVHCIVHHPQSSPSTTVHSSLPLSTSPYPAFLPPIVTTLLSVCMGFFLFFSESLYFPPAQPPNHPRQLSACSLSMSLCFAC